MKEWSTNLRLEHSNGEVRTTFSDVLFPTKKFSLERPEKLQNSVSFLFMVNNRSVSFASSLSSGRVVALKVRNSN